MTPFQEYGVIVIVVMALAVGVVQGWICPRPSTRDTTYDDEGDE